jgi:hypothetical protein
MNMGSQVTGNTASEWQAGGVLVTGAGSTFTMYGGEISGNTGGSGGVTVEFYAAFTMRGGEISGNSGTGSWGAGGVRLNSGAEFAMDGGIITGNTGLGSAEAGGVAASAAATGFGNVLFVMYGGEITGNMGRVTNGVRLFRGTFWIVTGIFEGLAAIGDDTIAQHGTFTAAAVWTSNGDIANTNATIQIIDGQSL